MKKAVLCRKEVKTERKNQYEKLVTGSFVPKDPCVVLCIMSQD